MRVEELKCMMYVESSSFTIEFSKPASATRVVDWVVGVVFYDLDGEISL